MNGGRKEGKEGRRKAFSQVGGKGGRERGGKGRERSEPGRHETIMKCRVSMSYMILAANTHTSSNHCC